MERNKTITYATRRTEQGAQQFHSLDYECRVDRYAPDRDGRERFAVRKCRILDVLNVGGGLVGRLVCEASEERICYDLGEAHKILAVI